MDVPVRAPGVSAGSADIYMVGKPSEPASLLCNSPLCLHRYDDGARGGPRPTSPTDTQRFTLKMNSDNSTRLFGTLGFVTHVL